MKIKIKRRDNLYIIFSIMFFALYIFSYQIRGIIFSDKLKSINFIALLTIFLLLLKMKDKINYYLLSIISMLTVVMICSQLYNQKDIIEIFLIFSCIIAPLILITINLNRDNIKEIFLLNLKYFNFIVILLFIFAIVDKVTNDSIAKFLADIFNDSSFYSQVYSNNSLRYYSFMGHPLYNTQIFLTYYLLNYMAIDKFNKKTNKFLVMVVSISGIAFTASKTGILLILSSMLIFNLFKKYKISYYVIVIVMFTVLLNMGSFDNLIYRFSTGTITSGRNEMWNILENYNLFPIKFLTGYGSGFNSIYNNYIPKASMAFEYPIRLFQLEYGVLFTILMYIVILLYPVITLIKRKEYKLLLGFLIIFIDVNTYNGIGLGMDIMLMFAVYTCMILNLSRVN